MLLTMLPFPLLVFLLIVAGSSSEILEQNRPIRVELPIASPELIASYKFFLKSILAPDGAARRNLLIATGVIPHSPMFRSQRHFYETVSSDRFLSPDMYEYIKRQVFEILASTERFDKALRVLFGERLPVEEYTEDLITSTLLQTEEPTEYMQTSKDEFVTENSMDDTIEIVTVSYEASEELNDASTEKEFEEESPSLSTADDFTSDGTSTPNSFGIENFETTKPSSYADFVGKFEKLLVERLSFHDHETVPESPTETSDQSPETVPNAPEDWDFVTIGHDSLQISTTCDTDQSLIDDSSEVSPETSSEYSTTETLLAVTQTSNTDSDDSNVEEAVTSEYLQSILSQTLPIADVQLIDKVIPISADEYKYSLVKDPLPVESIDFPQSQSKQMQTDFPNKMTETQKLSKSTKTVKQTKGENMNADDELQRQIHKYRGIPGKHFPNYDDFPNSSFVCHSKKHIPGFYADQESKCQVFHVCWPFRRESFLCPIGTIFNQATLSCDHWYKSNCSLSQAYFDVNLAFDESESSYAGTAGPMVDTLLKASENDCPIRTEVLSSRKDVSKLYIADVHFSESTANEELTLIWKFLPVKAKIFIYPEPKFMDAVRTVMYEAKRSKLESESNISKPEEKKSDFQTDSDDEKQSKRINSVNLGILRELSSKEELEVNSV